MFITILNIMLFNSVEEVTIEMSLLIRVMIVLIINLVLIFNMIVNSEFIIIIFFKKID